VVIQKIEYVAMQHFNCIPHAIYSPKVAFLGLYLDNQSLVQDDTQVIDTHGPEALLRQVACYTVEKKNNELSMTIKQLGEINSLLKVLTFKPIFIFSKSIFFPQS
jgi:hypothetical protein